MHNITETDRTNMQQGTENDQGTKTLNVHTYKLMLFLSLSLSNIYSLFQVTHLGHLVEAFSDLEQNLFVSLAQPEPSD
jgi:hypothetical protein